MGHHNPITMPYQAMPSYLMARPSAGAAKSKGLLLSPPLKWNMLQQLMQRWKPFGCKKITAELFPSAHELITLYSNNQAAQSLATNETTMRTKHIDIQYHFIWEAIENAILKMVHCLSNIMAADMLIKAVPHGR